MIVSTKKEIAEFSEAACLSQRAVYADVTHPLSSSLRAELIFEQMFGFKHTMNKYEHNTNAYRVIRTRLFSRVLQVNGPNHLSALYPCLLAQLDSSLTKELHNGRALNGEALNMDTPKTNLMLTHELEEISLPVAQTVRRMASKLMGIMFFGENLGRQYVSNLSLWRAEIDFQFSFR